MSSIEPVELSFEVNGRRIAGLDWGGEGPDVLLLHPNGFCAGIFDPVVTRLGGRYHCFGLDLCGHGATDGPDDLDRFTMQDMAAEVAEILDRMPGGPVRVVGHSLGGVVGVLLERLRPERIDRLVLFEPVIIPPPPLSDRTAGPSPISEGARRRRRVWASRAEMAERFRTVAPLSGFAPDALDAYLRHGVRDRDDGQVELSCDPAMEAAIFECTAGPRGSWPAWEHLPSLRAPLTVVSGRDTTLPEGMFDLQAQRAGAVHRQTEGGHLFPEEHPAATAELLLSLLG